MSSTNDVIRSFLSEWAEGSSAPSSLKKEVIASMEAALEEEEAEGSKVRSGPDDAPPDFRFLFASELGTIQQRLGARASYLASPGKTNLDKLQVSVAPALNTLLRAWAASEGREVTSVLLQAVEVGLRTLKTQGSIPSAAIEHYEQHCRARLALAEAKSAADAAEYACLPF